ncbi:MULTISPECIES: DUF1858 domain-containing protein [Enterococcus]|uniref:DUF1858 domain-containing protein n=1 Tax=Enterococcus alcedinis TaxID=1274384 RepID=A0A917JGI5_9ENTE|nr:DUF1858 domain-containing protein [Enterococcus alcedinis]MBP2102126.1 hypothetical protein [Enterococcus alcedinis]GGI65687.1 hypothetical protein GCM10011482_13410 [Enterococcus alcedinis]
MEIDFSKSLYELVSQYPIVKEIMFEIGFKDIVKPGMLQTAGRYVTIPKGAKMKKIPLATVIEVFEAKGFQIIGVE